MPAPPNPLSRHLVDRQEALFPKLEALARELETLARDKPGRAVPEGKRLAAEAMLCEAQRFRPGRLRGLVGAAPHCAGLAAQLAEALAALVAFEGRHTQWDSRVRVLVWRFAPHEVVPVRRFAPRPGSRAAARMEMDIAAIRMAREVYMREIRAKLVKRLEEYKRRDPSQQSAYALSRLPSPVSRLPSPVSRLPSRRHAAARPRPADSRRLTFACEPHGEVRSASAASNHEAQPLFPPPGLPLVGGGMRRLLRRYRAKHRPRDLPLDGLRAGRRADCSGGAI